MPRWMAFLLFVPVFLGLLIAGLPASFVARQLDLRGSGVDYMRISGTVWSGEVARLHVAGQPLGRAGFRLKPGALMSGRLAYDLDLSGPAMQARGELGIGPDRSVRLAGFVGDVNLQEIDRLDPRLREAPASLALTLRHVELSRDGQCVRAEGGVRTDLLETAGQRWNWAGPAMRGNLECDGAALRVSMTGATAQDDIAATARLDIPAVTYDVTARVETGNRGVMQALRALDFEEVDGRFVYERTNAQRVPAEKELRN